MEDAKGIPQRGKKGTIPKDRFNKWKLNVQEHRADRAGRHYDIRLNPPNSDKAYSWAARHFPGPGEKTTAVQTDVHAKDYLGFSGEIKKGYGKGKVDSLTLEDVEVLKSDDDHIKFNRYKGRDTERYIMMRKPGTDEFLFYNYTPTESTGVYKDVPKYKEKYKNVPLDKLDPKIRNDKEIWSPKLDGAHNLVVLRGDKQPDVFSYRKSRREGDKFIDHTYRTKIYDKRVPKEFKKTILRGELYIPGQPGQETARLLNSNVWKSRETQQKEGKPLELGVFDVVKWKGKNVEKLPYQEKIPMLKEVEEKMEGIRHTPWYQTEKEKETLRRQILNKENPLTEEGIAIYDLDRPTPRKSKKEDDWDGEIVGVFKASPGSKYQGNAIGGFLVKPEDSNKILRVGSGLDDETRRDAYENPDKYKGEWGKFKSQRVHDSGKHQAPIFLEMRADKFYRPQEKTAQLIKKLASKMSEKRKAKEVIKNFHNYMKQGGGGALLNTGYGDVAATGIIGAMAYDMKKRNAKIEEKKRMKKEAFLGVGVPVKDISGDGEWTANLGLPYLASVSRNFGDGSVRPSIGLGLAGPYVGATVGHKEKKKNNETIKKAGLSHLIKESNFNEQVDQAAKKEINEIRKDSLGKILSSGAQLAAFSGGIDYFGGKAGLLPKRSLKRSAGIAALFGGMSSAFTAANEIRPYKRKVQEVEDYKNYLKERNRMNTNIYSQIPLEKTSELGLKEGLGVVGGVSGATAAAIAGKHGIPGLLGGSIAGVGVGAALEAIIKNKKKNKKYS